MQFKTRAKGRAKPCQARRAGAGNALRAAACEALESRRLFNAYMAFGPGNGQGQLEVLGYDWSVSRRIGAAASAGEFHFTTKSDAASPGVMAAVASRAVVEPVTVVETEPLAGGGQRELARWTLHDVTFITYHSGDAPGANPVDSFSANFDRFEYSRVTSVDAKGQIHTDTAAFDFAAQKGTGAGHFPLAGVPATQGLYLSAAGATALANGSTSIASFQWGATHLPPPPGGGTAPAPIVTDVNVTMSTTDATELLRAGTNGAPWPTITLTQNGAAGAEQAHWTLHNVSVTSWRAGVNPATGSDDARDVQVTLHFDQIDLSNAVSPSPVTTSWQPAVKAPPSVALGGFAEVGDRITMSDGAGGSFPVGQASWGASNDATPTQVGATTLGDFFLTDRTGGQSPWLVQKLAAGTAMPKLTVTRFNPVTQLPAVVWELSDVRVTSYNVGGLNDNTSPTESFALNPSAVTQRTYDASGNLIGTAIWETAAAKGAGPSDFGGAGTVAPSGSELELSFGSGAGSIAPNSFGFDTSSPPLGTDLQTGQPTRTGLPTNGGLTITSPSGAASASILAAAELRRAIPTVTLLVRTPASAGGKLTAKYTLGNVLVSSYQIGTTSNDPMPPSENFTLLFQSLAVDYFAPSDAKTPANHSTIDYTSGKGTPSGKFPLSVAAVQPLLPTGAYLTATGPQAPLTSAGAVPIDAISWGAAAGNGGGVPATVSEVQVALGSFGPASLAMFDGVVNTAGHWDQITLSLGAGAAAGTTRALFTLHDAYVTQYSVSDRVSDTSPLNDSAKIAFRSLDYQYTPLDAGGLPLQPIVGTWQAGDPPLDFGTPEPVPPLNTIDFTPGASGGQAQVNGFSWTETRAAAGSGGNLRFFDANFIIPAGEASPALYQAVGSGRTIPSVVINGDALAGSNPSDPSARADSTWTLSDVTVSSFSEAASTGGQTEQFTLRATAIKHTVRLPGDANPNGYTATVDLPSGKASPVDFGGKRLYAFVPDRAPTQLSLSGTSMPAASPAGTVVGQLSGVDPDGDALTFSLTDNADGAFTIVGNSVQVADASLVARSGQFPVTVRATDPSGLWVERPFTITVVPFLQSITVNDGSAQRAQVTSLTLSFDEPVALADGAAALQLLNSGGSGANDGSAPTDASSALVAPPTTEDDGKTWVFTFDGASPFVQKNNAGQPTGSLVDGIFKLSVDPNEVSVFGGVPLAAPGALTFHRLQADIDGDRSVGPGDFNLLASHFGSTGQTIGSGDITGDGTVGPDDFNILASRFGKTLTYPSPQLVLKSVSVPPARAVVKAAAPTASVHAKRVHAR